MALNASIPLQVKTAEIAAPMAVLSDVLKMRADQNELKRQQQQQQAEQRRIAKEAEAEQKALAKETAIKTAYQNHVRADGSPDYDAIVNEISPLYPEDALTLKGKIAADRRSAIETRRAELQAERDVVEQGAAILRGVKDEATYQSARPKIAKLDAAMADHLGPTYNPALIKSVIDSTLSHQEYTAREDKANELALSGRIETAVSRLLPVAKTAEEWANGIQFARDHGLPETTIKMLGEWDEGAPTRAAQMLLTQAERNALENQKRDDERAVLAAENAKLEKEAAARLTRETRDADDKRQDARDAALDRHAREMERIGWAQEGRLTAGGGSSPAKDDPTLPNGVQQYLATLRSKYKTHAEAEAELRGTFHTLIQAHPKISSAKAYGMLDALFGKRTATDAAPAIQTDDMGDQTTATPTTKAPPATTPSGQKPLALPSEPAAATSTNGVPDAVAKALKDAKPGVYTMDDGTPWKKDANGTVQKTELPKPPRNVAAALEKLPPGEHTLTNGTVWVKYPNGTVMQTK